MAITFRSLVLATTLLASGGLLSACSGGGGGSGGGSSAPVQGPGGGSPPPPPAPAPVSTVISDEATAARFLSYATFGGSESDINALVGRDAADWLSEQFAAPPTLYLPRVIALMGGDDRADDMFSSNLMWDGMVANNDQVNTRTMFALSQILVVEDREGGTRPRRAAYYMDVLSENALGNYRDLLQDITYTPIMARYLTYYRNRKGDERTGRMPDENYAREVMQLFTIGLNELNMDGTLKLSGGSPIETYNNDDVVGLSRVFTGLSAEGERFNQNDDEAMFQPLKMFEERHSELEKTFLGTTIPPGTPGDESISLALDTLFEHPNVAPFISRQLIQRMTASSPSPAYVERVATAFETGRFTSPGGQAFGTGERGDMQATVAAILLDDSLFSDSAREAEGAGKIREPILLFTHWARAFDVANVQAANERDLRDTRSPNNRLAQHPLRPPSVFNFYRPGYIAPNSASGEMGLTAPELQIFNETSSLGYIDFMSRFVFDRSREANDDLGTYTPDYSSEIALADDPAALADHLSVLLTGGRMEAGVKDDIISVLEAYPIETDTADEDRLRRVHMAVLIAINAPSYRVMR